jgi:hypothetical protein
METEGEAADRRLSSLIPRLNVHHKQLFFSDTDVVLLGELSSYVYRLQGLVISHSDWGADQFNAHFAALPSGLGKLFKIIAFTRGAGTEFNATIAVVGADNRIAKVSHETNAGMRKLALEPVTS